MSRLPDRPVLLHVFSTFEPGGVQLRTRQLLRAFRGEFQHVLVTLDSGRTSPGRTGRWLEGFHPLPKRGSLWTILGLRELMERVAPDLVLTYDWGAIDAVVANAVTGRRVLVHHEDGFTEDEALGLKRRRIWARRLTLRWAHRVVVPSWTMEQRARRLWNVDAERVVRIASGVDLRRFRRDPGDDWLRRRCGLAPDAPVVGTVAGLRPIKNLSRLLEAFRRISRLVEGSRLVVAGQGPERARLEQLARDLGVARRVDWLGHVDRPEKVLRGLDVFLLTSDREEHPRALLEAMASECAVVSTDVGDVARILARTRSPYPIAPDPLAPDRIALTTADLLRSPAQRREQGRRNRQRVAAAYSLDRMLGEFRRLYDEVVRRRVTA